MASMLFRGKPRIPKRWQATALHIGLQTDSKSQTPEDAPERVPRSKWRATRRRTRRSMYVDYYGDVVVVHSGWGWVYNGINNEERSNRPRNLLPPIVSRLLNKGVHIPCPFSVEIDPAVDPDRIATDVIIHTGCKIHGADIAIGPGCELGAEAPATIVNCQLGREGATFLDRSAMGSGSRTCDPGHCWRKRRVERIRWASNRRFCFRLSRWAA